ncbi:hypothetical protein RchiOBHm_Chr4g0409271 [Rosa chinensis]|uniref:Uncharacterized protein n=1 Tax=Rosa chinensis TaxID=74649 RepID=A0A2P6QV19_ROSCH|nr:hypothetical protein RchiOBHm_Chr4g0409271 [Rosa chinensis]
MQLCEVERMSVVPDSLGDLAQQEEETVSIQVQRIGSEEVDEPVLIQVKKEGSKEVDEAETMSEVPNSLAEQQLEPVPIQVKKEGSDKMDEAERLQQSKPERLEYNEGPVPRFSLLNFEFSDMKCEMLLVRLEFSLVCGF